MNYDRVGVYRGYRLEDGEYEWQHVGEFEPRKVRLPEDFERLSLVLEDSTGELESIGIEIVGTI